MLKGTSTSIEIEVHSLESVSDALAWDELVLRFPGATVFQTAAWVRYERRALAARHFALVARAGGTVSGVLLASLIPHGVERVLDRPGASPLAWLLSRIATDLVWMGGPLAADPDTFDRLVREAVRIGLAHGAHFAGPWRPPYADADTSDPVGPADRADAGAVSFPRWPRQRECTVLVDLRRPVEELWTALHPSARKAVRKAEHNGLRVECAEDLETARRYHRFFRLCRRERGMGSYGFRPGGIQWSALREGPTPLMESLGVLHGGELVAVMSVWRFAGIVRESALAQSRSAVGRRLRGADLLKWWVISRYSRAGDSTYDLSGVDTDSRAEASAGIARFKSKWGGRAACRESRLRIPIAVALRACT